MTRRDLSATHAWRGAFVSASLNAIGMPADYFLARGIPDMPWYPAAFSALTGLVLIGWLLLRRERPTVRLGSVAFLVNTAAIIAALWITSGYWAAGDVAWTPFQANKLGTMASAILAPGIGVGLIAIGGFTAMAIGKYFALDPVIQDRLPIGEPWIILFYTLFASALLAYHLRMLALERETLRLQAETEAVANLARTFVRLRDYANTPIQTIAFTAELMRGRHPDLERDLGRLERAVERLLELSHALNRYESTHRWAPGEESLDAQKLAEHLPGARTG